ncbi:hypothetical protein [Frigoriglobus tundricola]|nr:hypothetical protein [Frigoriglobus tundricola]
MNDQLIINQIRTTRSSFQLTVLDLEMLKANGVSDRVVAEMQAARGGPVVVSGPGPVIYDSPPVYAAPPPVVVVGAPRPYYYGGGYYYRRGW